MAFVEDMTTKFGVFYRFTAYNNNDDDCDGDAGGGKL